MNLRLGPERNTYTIIAYCPRTQRLGVAIATFSLAVGGYCPRVEAGVGAVASQAYADPRLIPPVLDFLKKGFTPEKIIEELSLLDPFFAYRQIGIVDSKGNTAAHTGEKTTAWKGHICGSGYVAMGNCLAEEKTITNMSQHFKQDPTLELEERLLYALEAGGDAGGQSDPMNERSAALIVYEQEKYPRVDLRVDLHQNAIQELRRVYETYKPYIPLYYDLRIKNPDKAPSQLEWISKHC